MRNLTIKLTLLFLVVGCAHTAADRKVSPTVFADEFWRSMVWQRYDALTGFVDQEGNKKLHQWLGPKREPGIRILESRMDELTMPGETTAEIDYFIRYYIEPEYVERVTTVTQIWERTGQNWRLTGGYPLDHREAVQPQ